MAPGKNNCVLKPENLPRSSIIRGEISIKLYFLMKGQILLHCTIETLLVENRVQDLGISFEKRSLIFLNQQLQDLGINFEKRFLIFLNQQLQKMYDLLIILCFS